MLRRQGAKWLRPRPIDNATPYTRKTAALMEDILSRRQTRDAPFFLFVNILQAHQNYCPPLPRRRFSGWHQRTTVSPQKFYLQDNSPVVSKLVTTYANLYDDEILYLDSVLGHLWQVFQAKSVLDNTVIIITSDHGEHFGERGHYTHIMSLYNELLWVPLLVHFPRPLGVPGKKDRRLVSLNDLYATILDLVDSPLPRPTSSYSLIGPPQREVAIAQCVYPEMWQRYLEAKQRLCQGQGEAFPPPIFAVMTDEGRKVIEKRDGSLEVYDLRENLIETEDLSPGLPPEVLKNYGPASIDFEN